MAGAYNVCLSVREGIMHDEGKLNLTISAVPTVHLSQADSLRKQLTV